MLVDSGKHQPDERVSKEIAPNVEKPAAQPEPSSDLQNSGRASSPGKKVVFDSIRNAVGHSIGASKSPGR